MEATASQPATAAGAHGATHTGPVAELLQRLKLEAYLGVEAVEGASYKPCCNVCTFKSHGGAVLAACEHRDRAQQLLENYQHTGDARAAYSALRECRGQAEAAANTPGPDEGECARRVNVAISKRYRDALAKLEPLIPQPPAVPDLSPTQPPRAALKLLFANNGGKAMPYMSAREHGGSFEQSLAVKEGIECGSCGQLPAWLEAKALKAAQAASDAVVAKALEAASQVNHVTYIAARNTARAAPRELVISRLDLSKATFYYQIVVEVPLTLGAPPLTLFGGFIVSSREINM
ncbi:hypothetical protein HXX76_015967 [Chlamydomonas incerta]|uniref:Uncharacterized protein n=1 Tax=Chlamydomonas incerta TaxID=51695 RepID=A0A835S836_CHLIN|nr:hypothetical protein HXX76_015967 [Chlamydomonas incerta]|eukprot:KAG2422498.1 hypothetical protein HXX76_015967 [Chlamydomonas incerta]